MKNIMESLDINFEYEYNTLKNAMQMIDDNIEAIFFPYKKPRLMSNRILLSDTLYVASHSIFYDSRVIEPFDVNSFRDLSNYIVGSHGKYSQEINLRRAGLTVHYSKDNKESFEKLLNGDLSIVPEEKIQGLILKNQLVNDDKSYINFIDARLFPEYFFCISSSSNVKSSDIITKINELIKEDNYIYNIVTEFISNF